MPLFRQTYTLEDAEPVIETLYDMGFTPGRQTRAGTPFFYAERRIDRSGEPRMRITASSNTELYERLTKRFESKVSA